MGIALSVGGAITTPGRAVVQNGGEGFRLKADLLKQEFERHGSHRYVLLRYIQSLVAQMAKAAGSYRHHS